MGRIAAVMVAAVLVLAGCGDNSSSLSSGPGVTGPSIVDAPFRCPDPHAHPADVVDHGAGTLPTGAQAAKLCLLDNRAPWIPPRGALRNQVDDLVAVVNQQKLFHPRSDLACGGVGAPAWSMVFRYADGTRTITGDNGGCWDLLVGATQRYGSKTVFNAFVRALVRERRNGHPRTFHEEPPTCPPRLITLATFDPVADASTARVAALCILHRRSSQRLLLTRRELATFRHDFATASQRRIDEKAMAPCSHKPTLGYLVRGLDAWREPFAVDIECGAYRLLHPGATRYWFARLLPRTQRLLVRLSHS
jgi:hypothetical protein